MTNWTEIANVPTRFRSYGAAVPGGSVKSCFRVRKTEVTPLCWARLDGTTAVPAFGHAPTLVWSPCLCPQPCLFLREGGLWCQTPKPRQRLPPTYQRPPRRARSPSGPTRCPAMWWTRASHPWHNLAWLKVIFTASCEDLGLTDVHRAPHSTAGLLNTALWPPSGPALLRILRTRREAQAPRGGGVRRGRSLF